MIWSAQRMGRVLLLLVLAACGDVDIRARCEPLGPAVRVLDGGRTDVDFVRSIGMFASGPVLVTWIEAVDPASSTSDVLSYGQWFNESLEPMAGKFFLGSGRPAGRAEMVRQGDRLLAQLWLDVEGALPAGPRHESVALWAFSPELEPNAAPVNLSLGRLACVDCEGPLIGIGGSWRAGPQGMAPITSQGVAGIAGIPEPCVGDTTAFWRLLMFDENRAESVLWDANPCQERPTTKQVSVVQLVPLADGGTGVLFRRGSGSFAGHVHYVRLDADFRVVSGPHRVGGDWEHSVLGWGYQPKAASAGNRVLFNERVDSIHNRCQVMRSIRSDGGDGELAPWQLPCVDEPEDFYTTSSDLVELPNGLALVVWGERPAFGISGAYTTPITPDSFDEGIYLTALTPEGKRASEILRVTDAAATAVSPGEVQYPNDFLVYVAADGWDVAVGWEDRRADAPGFYARRFRCEPTAGE